MKYFYLTICISILFFVASPSEINAQTREDNSQRLRKSRTEQARQHESRTGTESSMNLKTSFVNGEAPSTPGDNDLGQQWILKEKKKQQPFSVFADANGFYTNNVALARDITFDDRFFVSSVGASYQPKIGDKLQLEFTVKQSIFRYDEFNILDFDSLNIGGGLTYVIPQLWDIAVFGRYNYNRLTDVDEHNEFFRNNTLSIGFQKAFILTRSHYLYLGYASQFAYTDPEISERDEHGFYGGYHLNLTRSLETDLFYRIAYFNYNGDRDDLNQTLNAALRYNVTKWASLTASASYGLNRSSKTIFDYDVFNTGVGLALNIKF